MEMEFIKKNKEEIEIKIKNEDTAFFDLIVNIASSKREVDFVSLKKADNLIEEFTFYLKTKEGAAKDLLLTCIEEAEENLNTLVNYLEKSLPDKKNKE
jgi:DNA-directed RNA polymerase subunit L